MLKDHEIQKIVSDLRDIAVKYGTAQQLREQIHSYIVPILKNVDACPQCGSTTGVKYPRGLNAYCEDCGWPDSDFGKEGNSHS